MKKKYITPSLRCISAMKEGIMFVNTFEYGGRKDPSSGSKQSFNDWDDDEDFDEDE